MKLLILQGGSHRKRKFYALYDKIYRKNILEEAWKRVKQNVGAGGVDKVSIDDVKAYGENKLLDEITEELRTEAYRCKPVRSRSFLHQLWEVCNAMSAE